MKHDVEISVIVPVYNVQNYVRQCVDSILSQDFGDFEILLVDDCSTDGSLTLCEELYGTHPKMQILRLGKNMGPGAARNAGMSMARGKYITFVDADDVLMPNALSLMRDMAARTGAEVVAGNAYYRSADENGSVIRHGSKLWVCVTFERDFAMEAVYVLPDATVRRTTALQIYQKLSVFAVPWGKLYSREFLLKNQIRFPDRKVWDEDLLFMVLPLTVANPYVVMTKPFYVYRNHPKSISHATVSVSYMEFLVHSGILGLRYLDHYAQAGFFGNDPAFLDRIKNVYFDRMMTEKTNYVFGNGMAFGSEMDQVMQRSLEQYFGRDASFVKLHYCMSNRYFARLLELEKENKKMRERLKSGVE